jgi:uncharacterized coiled-coil DUF342 family protein
MPRYSKTPAQREAIAKELKFLAMERQVAMIEPQLNELKASRDNYRKKWDAERNLANYFKKKNDTLKDIVSAMRKHMRKHGVDFPLVLLADYAKATQIKGRPARKKKFEPKEAIREPLNDGLRNAR